MAGRGARIFRDGDEATHRIEKEGGDREGNQLEPRQAQEKERREQRDPSPITPPPVSSQDQAETNKPGIKNQQGCNVKNGTAHPA